MLGKQYPDKATALKGLKDTFSFVGKKADSVKEEVISEATKHTSELAKEVTELKRDLWYQKNPQYEPVRNLIERFNGDPKDIVNLPEFKEVFEKVKGYEETSKLKTVMESSPRLGQVRDSLSRAAEASKAGDTQLAESEAVKAVIGTYTK